MPAGSPRTTFGGGVRVPHCPLIQVAGKRKANELASSGDSSEPANKRPALDAGFAPLPSSSEVTGDQVATCSRVNYATLLAEPVTSFQSSGSLKPTAMGSDQSDLAVTSETVNRRMSSDMSGSLKDKPEGTATYAQVTNDCLPADVRPNKTLIFISGVRDFRTFLA